MRWERLGCVFAAEGQRTWMKSHAANPVAEPLGGDLFRVFFGSRDEKNRTHVGSVVIEVGDRIKLLDIAREPNLQPGEPGLFDDSGTSMACLVRTGEETWLFYLGWNLAVTVPFRNSIGLAIQRGRDGAFVKEGPAPLVDRSVTDPLSLSYPWVLHEPDGWRMWYGSILAWNSGPRDMIHGIKTATSLDGKNWERTAEVIVGPQLPDECVVCRPCVLRLNRGYRMWYCCRAPSFSEMTAPYRLGYAESDDGVTWERRDDVAGLAPSGEGFDSDEVSYPSVFVHRGATYLLYNGNDYGRTGFGIARAA